MSDTPHAIFARTLRVVYCPADPRVVDGERVRLEKSLKQLGAVQISTVKSLDDLTPSPVDLLAVAAQTVPTEQFPVWLRSFKQRVRKSVGIWTPAIILANLPFEILNEVMAEAVQDNWYFDILSGDQLSSIPIRVANLIRIHDHLLELEKYASTLESLSNKVQQLEDDLEALRSK